MALKDFYYTVKAKSTSPYDDMWGGNWAFPPIYQGFIKAISREEAKSLIEKEFNKVFPLRVMAKDRDKEPYLLSIKEVNETSYEMRLLVKHTCRQCGIEFTILDKYNHNYGTVTYGILVIL